ncbi:uncharacterized protein Triagg1_42 [Trichoderma aggressivum f. europaeum]|uniref:Uncharacterized protein n=1 Tax=Trichoderma aggressivum f. europaeum TaxID=173218 RepID=A0AAE1ILL5_9HYPO|nr:hypothetical protein Triagg1_42 [Trichoderma aggressivum f. europaeum]
MSLDVLEKLVMNCHLIGDDVGAVTVELIKRTEKNYLRDSETGPFIEPGSVLGGIGNYSQKTSVSLSQKGRPTVPVVFVASPYLRLRPLEGHQNTASRGDHQPRTLLQNLYGFDVTPNRDKTQIVSKIVNGSQPNDNALHVNQMWCLLIGSTILITMSDHTTKELLDGTIGERRLGHEPPIKVKIIDDGQKHHDIAVSSSITWVDLFKITMDAVQKKRSDFHYYDLRDENKVVITAERWIEIASSRSLRKSQFYTVYLTPRPNNADPRKNRPLLEYRRYDSPGILDDLSTRYRRSDASSERVGSSKKEPFVHESADRFTSDTASHPLFLNQDGAGFIVSSPDPQDPDAFYSVDKDIVSRSRETESVEGTNTILPLGIDNFSSDREALEASSTGNFTHLHDDVTGNMADIGGTIVLPETNEHEMNNKRIPHKNFQLGSEISVETYPSGPCIPTSSSTLRSAKEANMIKPLNEADEAISNSPVGMYYYAKVPELTEEEFDSRQDIPSQSLQEEDPSIAKESPTHQNVGSMAAHITAKDNNLPNSVSTIDHARGNAHQEMEEVKKNSTDSEITLSAMVQDNVAMKQAQSLGIWSPDKELMKQLVTVSRQVLWSFLPKTGSSTVHILVKRFWSCMDIIRRQLIWEESEREPHHVPTYMIRDFSATLQRMGRGQSPDSQKTSWAKCGDCRGGKHYSSAEEALKHFHDEHFDCHHRGKRPYDDPCYSWLHRIWHSHYSVRNERNGLLRNVQEFERELSELALRLNELHAMVTSKEDDSMGDLTVGPPLPKHIFYALQKMVQVFVLRSERLSLMTRIKASSGIDLSEISHKINELQRFEKTAKDRMLDLPPEPQAAGAEFLALAFISKSHNLLFEAKTSNPRHNDNTLKLYKHYASELQYRANQRPQKRVFLNIRNLEEELDGLDSLLSNQRECLHKFAKSISPDTLRLTTMTRVGQNRVEKAYQDNHTRQLDMRIQEVQNMKTRSRFLEEQVKQDIEIMEEDHGKAIRVFTIVTLFFLPMSFVSSFMGMNTADVRDMHYKQGLFWVTGIPVTLFVLTLACIYGYKGDEICDWAMQLSDCPKNKKLRLPVDEGDEVGEDYSNVYDVPRLPSPKKPRRTAHQRRRLKSKLPHGDEDDDGSREQ